jgi:hypothetical protein
MSNILTEERIKAAIEKADLAFWAEIAKAFPEAISGDFPPDADFAFAEACEQAVDTWLLFNHPERQS